VNAGFDLRQAASLAEALPRLASSAASTLHALQSLTGQRNHMWNSVVIIGGLLVLAILALSTVLAKMFRKAGPNEAIIVYGFRGPRVIKGGGAVIFPVVENSRQLSLELMSFDVAPQQDLYTKQGVAVTVEAVAQIKVRSDKESILTAAEQFLTKSPDQREGLIRLVMEGHLRGIIGQLTVEQIVKEPEMVAERMRSTCMDDMSKMGLEVISFTIREVRDKNEYITNMGRPDVARIRRDAEIAAAEAERDTAIRRAVALRRPLPIRSGCLPRLFPSVSRQRPSAISTSRRRSSLKLLVAKRPRLTSRMSCRRM